MSRANSPQKVLRVALKRVQERWGKGAWSRKGADGKFYVCLEGAITGGCDAPLTDAQCEAMRVVHKVINEKIVAPNTSIAYFNDSPETTQDDVIEVIKLGLIRLEFGDPDDLYVDDEEVESLLDKDSKV